MYVRTCRTQLEQHYAPAFQQRGTKIEEAMNAWQQFLEPVMEMWKWLYVVLEESGRPEVLSSNAYNHHTGKECFLSNAQD